MKIKQLAVLSAWQFNPANNRKQPPFVQVTTALGGPRAVAKPPVSPHEPYPPTFYLSPSEWLLQVEPGVYLQVSDHTYHYLVDATDG